MTAKMKTSVLFLFLLQVILLACQESDEGEGTIILELWGEDYIEESIPASAFEDGYTVRFDKFLINLGRISIAKTEGEPALQEMPMRIWDLSEEGPFKIASKIVPEGKYVDTRYTIAKANSSSISGNATEQDVQMMAENGYSVFVVGMATNGTTTVTFSWGFETETDYGPCESEGNVKDGGEATVQITIHGDHLFYDDAVSEQADICFNDVALADSNGDGSVTSQELLDYDITVLPNYGVGSLDIFNLFDFISHMTTTIGHIDGEGHCH